MRNAPLADTLAVTGVGRVLSDPPQTTSAAPASLTVVLNWIEELKSRVPAR
jgi:hypothetical protein